VVYTFFMGAPHEHLGIVLASDEAFVISIFGAAVRILTAVALHKD